MKIIRKLKNIIFITVVFCVLLVISEFVYILRQPTKTAFYSIEISKLLMKINKPEAAFSSLEVGCNIITHNKSKDYSFSDLEQNKLIMPNNIELKDSIKHYLIELPYADLYIDGRYDLPRVLYDIALLSLHHKESDFAKELLITARNIDPTLSYWHVELSNLYLNHNELDKAKQVLDECMEIPSAKDHCKEFLENIVEQNTSFEPGFLLKEMEKYYKYPSILTNDSDLNLQFY